MKKKNEKKVLELASENALDAECVAIKQLNPHINKIIAHWLGWGWGVGGSLVIIGECGVSDL